MSNNTENTDIRFLNFNNSIGNTIITKDNVDDRDLANFNKERTRFYIELIKAKDKNPQLVNKIYNKFNNINNRKNMDKSLYRKLINNKKLYNLIDSNTDDIELFELIKKKLADEDNDKKKPVNSSNDNSLNEKMTGGDLSKFFLSNDKKTLDEFNETVNNLEQKKKFIKEIKKKYDLDNVHEDDKDLENDNNPIQNFIDKYYIANTKYKNKINKEGVTEDTTKAAEKDLKKEISDIVEEFDNDPMNPLDILEIKNDDRIVFIAVTFIIRYITLLLVNWCIEIDVIKSFNDAFILFTFIYIVFFWLIVMIINVNISQDYIDNKSLLANIQSVLYYFYFRINDIGRLLVHTLLILLLLIIPIIVKSEKKLNDDPLTYDERIKLYNTLSLFTIFMWIFTSIIATKY